MRDNIDRLVQVLSAAKSRVTVQINETMSLMAARADGMTLSRAWSTSPMPAEAFHTSVWDRLEHGHVIDRAMLLALYPMPPKSGSFRVPVYFDLGGAMKSGRENFSGPVVLAVPADLVRERGADSALVVAANEIRSGQLVLNDIAKGRRSVYGLLDLNELDGMKAVQDRLAKIREGIKSFGVDPASLLDDWQCEHGGYMAWDVENLDCERFTAWLSVKSDPCCVIHRRYDERVFALTYDGEDGMAYIPADKSFAGDVKRVTFRDIHDVNDALESFEELSCKPNEYPVETAMDLVRKTWEKCREHLSMKPDAFVDRLREGSFRYLCGRDIMRETFLAGTVETLLKQQGRVPKGTACIGADPETGNLVLAKVDNDTVAVTKSADFE